MPGNDDFLELGGEGINALLETDTGDRVVHHVANTHLHRHSDSSSRSRSRSRSPSRRDSVHNRRRSSAKDTADGKWSIKSFWKGNSHQQKPRKPRSDSRSSPPKPTSKSNSEPGKKTPTTNYEKDVRSVELAQQRRRERFQNTKARYVPPETTRDVDIMRFEQDRLYADVGKAVRDATRRSEDALRNK